MSYFETLIELDLEELLGGQTPPDLVEATLARAAVSREPAEAARPRGRLFTLRRIAEAAVMVLAVGVIGWIVTRPRTLPEGIQAADGARYEVHDDHVRLAGGWVLLSPGAPDVRFGGARVHGATGRAMVGDAAIPAHDRLVEIADQLELTAKEKAMFTNPKRWAAAAGVSICLFTGSVMVDEQMITAEQTEKKVESPAPEEVDKVKALLGAARSLSIRALKDGQWGSWLMADSERTETAKKVLRDGILKPVDKPAGWSHANEFRFTLEDGREIAAAVYTYGKIVALKLPDWERWTDYDCTDALRQDMWRVLAVVADGPFAADFAPTRKWVGDDSRITEQKTVFVTNQVDWIKLWVDHIHGGRLFGMISPPVVDFATEMVVAVFAGESWNSHGFYVRETLGSIDPDTMLMRGTASWVVRVDEYTYQTFGPDGGGVQVRPYGIFVFPRKDHSIVVEENVQGMIGMPPQWKGIGARVDGITDPPKPNELDFVGERIEGTGGVGPGFLKVATSDKQLRDIAALLDNESVRNLTVDWEKKVVVAVCGEALLNMGNHKLIYVGRNPQRTAWRIEAPIAQAEEGARTQRIYSVWVLPKPAPKLVIETPEYSRIGVPVRWNEVLTVE